MDANRIGRYLCLILRHHPEEVGLKLDEHGWLDAQALIDGVNKNKPEFNLDMKSLEHIVETDSKNRYTLKDGKIRANQGHSIKVDLELEAVEPPEFLYHGTSHSNHCKIMKSGCIKSMSRQYVHLSPDIEVATNVGNRHVKEEVDAIDILKVRTLDMYKDGYKFYISANGVWLTDKILYKYIEWINRS